MCLKLVICFWHVFCCSSWLALWSSIGYVVCGLLFVRALYRKGSFSRSYEQWHATPSHGIEGPFPKEDASEGKYFISLIWQLVLVFLLGIFVSGRYYCRSSYLLICSKFVSWHGTFMLLIPYVLAFFLQGAFTDQNFDQDLNFHATEEDPVTKKVCIAIQHAFIWFFYLLIF